MQPNNCLSIADFLLQAGVTSDELNAEASTPQPAVLDLDAYNDILNQVSKSHPSFRFDGPTRRMRVLRRATLPKQVLAAKANIRAWEREIQALSTYEKADQVLGSAEAEMKLLSRMGTSGTSNREVDTHTRAHIRAHAHKYIRAHTG